MALRRNNGTSFRNFAREHGSTPHTTFSHSLSVSTSSTRLDPPSKPKRFLNEIKGIFGIPHVYFMVWIIG